MTKILVVSDTHGCKAELNKLIKDNPCDYVFFLGDTINDIVDVPTDNLYVVKGNWDITLKYKSKQYINIEGIDILLLHGYGYGVRKSLDKLVELAKAHNVKLVCYGHSHLQRTDVIDGITFVNPGAYSLAKGGKFTYSIVEIADKKIYVNMLKK
ncbi:MAG TPA: hypothetical protein DD621_00435 [Clostridiales bacterium]|nr:hypothetical protein [Clostridiales bacterium]